LPILLIASLVVILLFVRLAVPYWFEFSYWAEAPLAWAAYFVMGTILMVYVFYALLQVWRRLIAENEGKDRDAPSHSLVRQNRAGLLRRRLGGRRRPHAAPGD
jgi:hypothetical protein